MRNKIFGAIGVIWGCVIVGRYLLVDRPANPTGAGGLSGGLVVAALLVVVGLYYLVKGGAAAKPR